MYFLFYKDVYLVKFPTIYEAEVYVREAFLPHELPDLLLVSTRTKYRFDTGNSFFREEEASSTINPGSYMAITVGCICPVLDNWSGAGMYIGDEHVFVISSDCPVHSGRTS